MKVIKVIKVKTLDQWNEVLKVLFDRGNDWRGKNGHDLTTHPDLFTERYSRYLYVSNGEITHGKFSPNLYATVTSAEKFLKETTSQTIVLVKTISQWDNVLYKLFADGHTWPSGETEYKHHLWKFDQNNILGLTSDGNINVFNSTNKKYSTYDEFMGKKIYTVTKQEMEILQTVKNHVGIGLLQAVSNRKSELAAMESIGNGAILRWIGGDESIKIVPESAKYVLWTKDDNGRSVYYNTIHGVPTFDREQKNAVKFDTDEQAEQAANDFWTVDEYNG